MEKTNEDLIIQTNANLKVQLLSVSSQIEASLAQRKKKSINVEKNEANDYDIGKTISFLSQVDGMKKAINEIKHELENNHNYKEIERNENKLKEEKEILYKLKKEYDTLMKIKKNQQKSLREVDNKHNAKTELVSMSEKLKNLKDEYKILKDYNVVYGNKIKKQDETIMELNDRCNLIKENIDNKKRRANKNDSVDLDEEIKKYEEQAKENEKIAQQEERNYINAINKQNETLLRLEEENNIINIQIKHKEQETKINEFKLKELMKITSGENKPKKKKKIITSSNSVDRNYKPTSKLNKSERMKPFIIKQFGTRNVMTPNAKRYNKNITNNYYKENTQKNIAQKKSDVMDEIEQLKKDIQIALNEDEPHVVHTEESKKMFSKTYQDDNNIVTINNNQTNINPINKIPMNNEPKEIPKKEPINKEDENAIYDNNPIEIKSNDILKNEPVSIKDEPVVIKEEPKDSNNVQIDNEMANHSKIEDSLSNNIPTNEPIPVERSTPLVTKKNNRRPFDSIKFNK